MRDLRHVHLGHKLRPRCSLHAMDGPEPHLERLGCVNRIGEAEGGHEGFIVRRVMVGRKGDVGWWVPVFGGDFKAEWKGEEGVDGGGDGAAGGNSERAVLWKDG